MGLAGLIPVVAPKALLITLFGAGCVAVVGVGSYLSVRGSSVPQPATLAASPETGDRGPVTVEVTPPRPSASTVAAREAVAPSGKGKQASNRSTGTPVVPQPAETTPAPSPRPDGSSTATPLPSQAPSVPLPQAATAAPSPEPIEPPATVPDPPARRTAREELIVPQGKVIGIRLETPVSSETAKIEDRVTARIIRDVVVDGVTVVPTGARLEGTVTLVERGGKVQGQSRIGIRFTSLVLSSDVKLPIQTEVILRSGEGPGNEAAAKIGGAAVAGTILGSIFGGGKGAAIGGAIGAAGGTATVMAGNRNAAIIAAGTELTARLAAPLTVTVEREDLSPR
jgi:hypothetical protein